MAASSSSSSPSTKSDAPSTADLEAQIETLRKDFAELIDSLGAAGGAKASEIKAKAKEKAKGAYASAEAQAHRADQEISGFVRERPYAAIGIAAGIGFLAALLARR